jgi:hypothetical protein
VGGFGKVNVAGKAQENGVEAKDGKVRGRARPSGVQFIFHARWGTHGAARAPMPARPPAQVRAADHSPCLPPCLQSRTGVLTRRAAAQLAATGPGNAQVRGDPLWGQLELAGT